MAVRAWMGLWWCVLLLILPAVFAQNHQCPTRCLCFRTTVRCMFLQLEHVPQVPAETTILDLRFNRIREVQPGTFAYLHNLNTLLLNNNRIRKIPNGAFDGLSELRYLYLYKNEIDDIEERTFHGLTKLEQLYIHFNNLEDLHEDTFLKLPALQRLFLHNNRLKRLPRGVFANLNALRRLRLDSNALVCDCQMMWLSEMLKEKRTSTQAAATCEYPSNVQGKSLLSVTEEDFHCKKPNFIVQPNDVEVSFGSKAYFTCRADGDPSPEIVWLHNDNEIVPNSVDTSSRYSISNDGTLEIEQTRAADQGTYECVARNIAGEVKTPAVQLKHHGSVVQPRLVRAPKDQEVIAGQTVALECVASGNPTPTVSWTKDGATLPQDTRLSQLQTGSLLIANVQFEDQGQYRCVASSRLGSVHGQARLHVKVEPTFTLEPQDESVQEGASVTFQCQATGRPAPSLHWTQQGRPLPEEPRFQVSSSGQTLSISPVQNGDQGFYECVADNGAGTSEATATLSINFRVEPEFTRTPRDFQRPLRSYVELQCGARGIPQPTITWLRNSVPIIPSDRVFVSEEGDLAIVNLNYLDEGLYECIAENSVGSIRAYSKITVLTGAPGDQFVSESIREAIDTVNRAFNTTIRQLNDAQHPRSPGDQIRASRLPSTIPALDITRSAEIYERTLELVIDHINQGNKYNITHETSYSELISPGQLTQIANMSNCMVHRRIISCRDMCYHHKYRTYDGTCNNLRHPMRGASLTPLRRMIKPRYENGFNTPVGWDTTRAYNGFVLPSGREISLTLAKSSRITPDEQYSHMLMQFGQFLDHDMDFVPMAVSDARFSDGRFCNETCENQSPCFPIPVAPNDPRIRRHRCIGVTRSSAMCLSGTTSIFSEKLSTREQLNQITHYIDASNVYGSSEDEARDLRDLASQRGLLRTGLLTRSGKALLPSNVDRPVDCQVDPNAAHVPCFQAGDHRNNEQLGLLSMHTLWMREHNRIASDLLRFNPHWDGDMLYHEARKIVGAQLQHISYAHWLPKILGPVGMEMMGNYTVYDPTVDSTIANVFATAAFRFGHTLINPIIFRLNESFQPIPEGNLPLHRAFFAPFRIVEEGGIDPVLRGLFGVAAKKLVPGEGLLNEELTERLFTLAHEVGLDLGALNVQRGRDHGLPSYNSYRKICGLQEARTFNAFRPQIRDPQLLRKLQQVYGHPENVEVWVGGLLEEPLPGARIGHTFACLIADQFKRSRAGDRFWYENPGVFSPSQLTEIKQANLARVICDNADHITQIQKDVFLRADYPHHYLNCQNEDIPQIDLKVWTHCCHDCASSGEFNSITNHVLRRRRSVDFSTPEDPYERENIMVKDKDSEADDNELTSIYVENQPEKVGKLRHKRVKRQTDMTEQDNHIDDSINHGEEHAEHHHGEHHADNEVLQSGEAQHSHVFTMSNTMMDAIDSRIEGIEDIMGTAMKSIHKLNRKIRRLERRVVQNHQPVTSCIDYQGNMKNNGDVWREHDCRICKCKKHQLECTTETCQVPKCVHPKKVAGQCCPVC